MPHSPLKLAVLISGGGSTLANLIERIGDGRLSGVQIKQVISSRIDVRGNDIARRANLPLCILRPRDFASPAAFSAALTNSIDAAGVDLVVMGGFLCLYQIPAHYLGRVINIHPALLPAYGGRGMFGHHVHEAVIAAAERESGCTVHLADNVYDHGPIVAQRRVPVYAHDTPQALADRVGQAERELYPEVIARIAREGFDWLPRISSE
ncbi:MAG: phosphoribosylglycinamide formyltransferase [Phycisphaerae bacterium]